MTTTPSIHLARVYDNLDDVRGARLLVDRVWPRGVTKSELALDDWIREVAPSTALRKWFAHDVEKWEIFQRRYRAELDGRNEPVSRCLDWCRRGEVVLLFGTRDRIHNQAVVLKEYLCERFADR